MRASALGAALLLIASTAHASPEDLFGYGARSQGMGATGAASAEGYEAAYANPALLSRMRVRKLSLGLQGATFALDAGGDRLSYARAKGTVIGVDLPVPFGGVLEDRVGLGLAFYTPTDVVVRGKILYPETPQFPLLPDRAQSVAVRLGVGVDIGWGLRVGAGFAALAEINGSAIVATDATGRVGTRVEDQLVATYAPAAGLTYDLPLGTRAIWRAGLAYRGTLDARFAVVIDATKLSSLNIPLFNISGLAQYDPAQIALELARETPELTLALGATYKRWSAYPGLLEPTILCPADNADCGALTPPKVAYTDTLALHAGVDWAIEVAQPLTTHLRAGAFTDPNPLPSRVPAGQAYDPGQKQTVSVPTRYFNAPRVALTWGAGLRTRKPLPPIDLDVFGQYHLLVPTDHTSDDGTPLGKASGHVLVGGVVLGVRF
jgi:long-chain fatty acid transport protein